MSKNVRATVEKYRMLKRGDNVLAAVSGGPDSVALLFSLMNLAQDYNIKLHIFHLNHQLRPDADGDAEFVRNLGSALNIPTTVLSADVLAHCRRHKLSIQEGAREVRYRLLEETAGRISASKIATGHNANDAAETFIMRLLQGSGLTGLTGIPPVRDGRIIRPLIETGRDEIIIFLKDNNLEFIEDESNFKDKYYRNKLRLRLMPVLDDLSFNFQKTVLKTCDLLREEDIYLEAAAAEKFSNIAHLHEEDIYLSRLPLIKLGPVIGRRVIRIALRKRGMSPRRINSFHLQTIWESVAADTLSCSDLPDGISVCHENGQVVIFSRDIAPIEILKLTDGDKLPITSDLCLGLTVSDHRGGSIIVSDCNVAQADADRISWPLAVRSFKPGDRFIPFGMSGSKKVHDFFIDEKVPRRLRQRIPIVADQEKIIWIAGYRLDDRVKITEKTTKLAVIKMMARE